MKKSVYILFIISVASFASATIQVDWSMPNLPDIVFRSDGSTELPVNSVWQLIWTPDNAISDFNPLNPFEVDGTESLLEEYRNPDAGYIFGQGGSYGGASDTFVGGFVYTRVFDYQGSTSVFNVNDLDGMYYIESSAIDGPLVDTDANEGPAGTPNSHFPFTGSNTVNQQFAIPEPSSVMLIGIALSAMMIMRRRFRK